MNLNTLNHGESWMTPEERVLNHEFVHAIQLRLTAEDIPESPLIVLRVNDVVATWLLAQRLESALAPEPGEPAPCPTAAQASAIGKCRDRLRRAMKELEASLAQGGERARHGLAKRRHETIPERANPGPGEEPTGHKETHTAQIANPDSPHHPDPAGDGPCVPIGDKSGARDGASGPLRPQTAPPLAILSPNRAARRHLAREEKRLKKTGFAPRARGS